MSTKLAATARWLLGPLRVGVLGESPARGLWAAGGRGRGSDGAGPLAELRPRACLLEMLSPSCKCNAVYGERTCLH